ncbi:MAG: flagellar basal body-associated FliL family protein [Oscillospiraceae bacterium]|nr:flagellar basal body-associated FliL family protein [Oscillospiraceae bacterium]
MKRKLVILLLTALPLCLALAACGDEPPPTPPPTFLLEIIQQFRNNVKDDPTDDYDVAYVFCRVSVEAVSEEELVVLTENESRVRDIINATLRAKTLKELVRGYADETLKAELGEKIVLELSEKGITELGAKGIYFPEFYTTRTP